MTTPPVCDYEGSDYQARFWDRGDRAYEDQVEAIALRRLLPSGGERLLELGAGAGRNTSRYEGFQQVVLVDFSRSQLEQARARLGGGERYLYVAADVYHLPFAPAIFPASTMIRTLHHMADPQAALRQARGCMASGGSFILEFANKRNLKSIARWVARRQAWNPFDRQPVEFAELNFDFHPDAVTEWLQAAGFVIERRLTVSHFRMGLLKRFVPLRMLVALDALAQHTGNLWQLSPSVFLRARSVGADDPAPAGAFWRCPACGSLELRPKGVGLSCHQCGRMWGGSDGIYDFRIPAEGSPQAH